MELKSEALRFREEFANMISKSMELVPSLYLMSADPSLFREDQDRLLEITEQNIRFSYTFFERVAMEPPFDKEEIRSLMAKIVEERNKLFTLRKNLMNNPADDDVIEFMVAYNSFHADVYDLSQML